MNEFLGLFNSFNWHSPTWDLFIFGAWILSSIFYAFAAGRGRIINILVSVYMAQLLVLKAPFLANAISGQMPETLGALQQMIVFLVIFLLLFLLLGRYVFKTSADHRHMSSMVFGLVFAFLQIGLLISIILNYLPDQTKTSFSQLIRMLFVNNPAPFVWLILPVVYLILLGKFVGDSSEI